jgi:hypothetical protein
MPTNYDALPPIAHDPAHDAVVSTLNRLRQTQREGFLSRVTGSHTAALFLREVLYWLSPSDKAPARPRSTVYRNGAYWMVRTHEEWQELDITRTNLSTVYRHCEDLIERDYRMFAAQRRTHYRIKFDKLRELMERDEILQACLESDAAAAQSRRASAQSSADPEPPPARTVNAAPCSPVNTDPCSPVNRVPCPPSVHSLEQSEGSIAITSTCSPSAHSGAAAPEPPPPARTSTLDSVETAPALPEVTFKQAQAILGAAEGTPIKEKLMRAIQFNYDKRSRLAVGYLLIWQAVSEKHGQPHGICEKHFLQSLAFAEKEVEYPDFYRALKAAWEAKPTGDYDRLFLCTRHARKLTSFFKYFEEMEGSLKKEDLL